MTADDAIVARVVLPAAGHETTLPLVVTGVPPDARSTRDAIVVPPATTASFGTYSAGLPGAWWRAATGARRARLSLTVDGSARVRVLRSDAAGRRAVVAETSAEGDVDVAVDLPEADGGWLWCEVQTAEDAAEVSGIRWSVDVAPRRPATVTVAITTFDREADCLGVLAALAADAEVLTAIDRVVVVDQGSRSLRDVEGFGVVAALLGERLQVLRQPNLGGSGGFSRGMLAALAEGSEFALLLDDDIRLDPESLRRLLAFASRTERPTIVGAHMLSLVDPTVLHSFGERVDRRTWLWRPVVPALAEVDLRTVPLTEPALHRRVDVEFNGWWMCLVPTALIRDQGAALPLFIKWDDTEFALRAAAAGVPTVTLPGAAVWHMPWTAKDDGLDWQAYFQLRNRLLTALLHGGARRETGVLVASLAQDVNHLLCLQYGSAAVRRAALRDLLSGPGHLAGSALTARRAAQRVLARAGQVVVDADAGEPVTPSRPRGRMATAARLGRVLLHQLRPPHHRSPVRLRRVDGKWWAIGLADDVAVESASGRGVFLGRRDRRTALSLARDAVVLRVRLWWRWPRLAAAYRAAAPALASPAGWDALIARAGARPSEAPPVS